MELTSTDIERVDPTVPQTWWQQQAAQMKDTPWWYEAPTYHQPLQTRPWYLPEVEAPELTFVDTSLKVTLLPAGILMALGLATVGYLAITDR